jgi:hypothetical protein
LNHDINNKSNFEDFELIFKKLVHDFRDILDDDDDDEKSKMDIVPFNT